MARRSAETEAELRGQVALLQGMVRQERQQHDQILQRFAVTKHLLLQLRSHVRNVIRDAGPLSSVGSMRDLINVSELTSLPEYLEESSVSLTPAESEEVWDSSGVLPLPIPAAAAGHHRRNSSSASAVSVFEEGERSERFGTEDSRRQSGSSLPPTTSIMSPRRSFTLAEPAMATLPEDDLSQGDPPSSDDEEVTALSEPPSSRAIDFSSRPLSGRPRSVSNPSGISRFCASCGHSMSPDMMFCGACGSERSGTPMRRYRPAPFSDQSAGDAGEDEDDESEEESEEESSEEESEDEEESGDGAESVGSLGANIGGSRSANANANANANGTSASSSATTTTKRSNSRKASADVPRNDAATAGTPPPAGSTASTSSPGSPESSGFRFLSMFGIGGRKESEDATESGSPTRPASAESPEAKRTHRRSSSRSSEKALKSSKPTKASSSKPRKSSVRKSKSGVAAKTEEDRPPSRSTSPSEDLVDFGHYPFKKFHHGAMDVTLAKSQGKQEVSFQSRTRLPKHLIKHCMFEGCPVRFSMFGNKKNSCRLCGKIFCNTHCCTKIPLPHIGEAKPVKTCVSCIAELNGDPPPPPLLPESAEAKAEASAKAEAERKKKVMNSSALMAAMASLDLDEKGYAEKRDLNFGVGAGGGVTSDGSGDEYEDLMKEGGSGRHRPAGGPPPATAAAATVTDFEREDSEHLSRGNVLARRLAEKPRDDFSRVRGTSILGELGQIDLSDTDSEPGEDIERPSITKPKAAKPPKRTSKGGDEKKKKKKSSSKEKKVAS